MAIGKFVLGAATILLAPKVGVAATALVGGALCVKAVGDFVSNTSAGSVQGVVSGLAGGVASVAAAFKQGYDERIGEIQSERQEHPGS